MSFTGHLPYHYSEKSLGYPERQSFFAQKSLSVDYFIVWIIRLKILTMNRKSYVQANQIFHLFALKDVVRYNL